jgi:hypothetical protein
VGLENGVRGMKAGLLPLYILCTTLYTTLHTTYVSASREVVSLYAICTTLYVPSYTYFSSYTSICLSPYTSMHVISRQLVPLYTQHYSTSARIDIPMCPRMHPYMCPHMLLYICWLIYFLYMCPHTEIQAQNYFSTFRQRLPGPAYMCPHIQAQNYRCVLIYRHTLYMCPHIQAQNYRCVLIYRHTLYVSSYTGTLCICVLICRHRTTSLHSGSDWLPHIQAHSVYVSSYTGTLCICVLIYRRRTTSLHSGSDWLG